MWFHILLDDSNLGTGENQSPIILKSCKTLFGLKQELGTFFYHHTAQLSPEKEEKLNNMSFIDLCTSGLYHEKYKIMESSPEKDLYIENILQKIRNKENKHKLIGCHSLSKNYDCCHAYVICTTKEFVLTKDDLKIMFPYSCTTSSQSLSKEKSFILNNDDFPPL